MSYQPYPINVISTANSSTANLAGAAAFTGTSEDVSAYADIRVSVYSSHVSATNGLSIQQSTDGTNWDMTDAFTVAATTAGIFCVPVQARYFRVVYTNGATLTTSLRIMSVFHGSRTRPSAIRPQDARTNEIDTEEMSAYPMQFNGTTWDRQRGDTTNGLDVDVTRLPSLVAGAATIGAVNIAAAQTLATVTTVGTVTTLTGTTTLTPGTAAANLGKAEDGPHTTGDVGVMALAVRADTAAATGANTDYVPLLTDSVGALWTRSTVELADDSTFTPGTTRVVPIGHTADETSTDLVDEGDIGAPRMTLDRKAIVTPQSHTNGGATPYQLISGASTNATSLKGSAGQIYSIAAFNLNASPRYLKIYNKASAPTVGTDTPLHTLMIPGNATGTGFTLSVPVGMEFTTGIAFALTTGIAVADTGAVAANEQVVNITYK